MILPNSQQLEKIKKQFAENIILGTKERKIKLDQESFSHNKIRQQELKRLEDLEIEFKKVKERRMLARKSSASVSSSKSKEYLDHLSQLHMKAKDLMKAGALVDNFPKPPPLEESSITSVNKSVDHIRVPILVPQSVLKKSLHAKPPMYNHVIKSGEIISVHLLNESMPTFDPLVKAEAKIPKNELGTNKEIIADISYHEGYRGRVLKSVSPIKHKISSFELSQPEGLHIIRETTPKDKFERHNFRDNDVSESKSESQRSWVSKRMKMYSKRIKDACKPQISVKKQIEMEIMKEKLKTDKPFLANRIKLKEIM